MKGYKPYKGKKYGWMVVTAVLGLLFIAVIAIILSVKAGAVSWTYKQTKAHEIAEIARSMGLEEDDPIIQRAKEIWYEEKAAQKAAPKLVDMGTFKITGYVPTCSHCCGKSDGITASGEIAEVGKTVAMKGYPFGTKIYIEGLGYYTVQDRGVDYGVIDVACANHNDCYAITGWYHIYLVEG